MFQVLPSVGYYHAGSILQVTGQDWQVCGTLLLFYCPIPALPFPQTLIGLQRLRNLRSVKNFGIIQNKDREICQVIYPLMYVATETSHMVPHTS